jgi:hypothetical protein
MENVRSNRGIRLSNRHDSGRELANPEKYQKKGNHKNEETLSTSTTTSTPAFIIYLQPKNEET